jgi:hypothetical protein
MSSCVLYSVTKEKRRARAFKEFACQTPLRNTPIKFSVQGGIYGKIVDFGTATTDEEGYFQSPVLGGRRLFRVRLTSDQPVHHLKTKDGVDFYALKSLQD